MYTLLPHIKVFFYFFSEIKNRLNNITRSFLTLNWEIRVAFSSRSLLHFARNRKVSQFKRALKCFVSLSSLSFCSFFSVRYYFAKLRQSASVIFFFQFFFLYLYNEDETKQKSCLSNELAFIFLRWFLLFWKKMSESH